MKLKSFIAALNAAILCILLAASPAGSGSMTLLGAGKTAVAGGAASYTFAGSADNNGSVGNAWTTSTINIGPAAASRLVVVCLAVQNNPALTVTVNGVSLTQAAAIATSGNQAALWYGSIPSGSGAATIVVTGGNFLLETMLVYYATGLGSNTPVATTSANGGSGTLAANSGDFIFASYTGGAPSWAGSTQTPTGTQSDITQASAPGYTADWIVASTGTFTVTVSPSEFAAANWR